MRTLQNPTEQAVRAVPSEYTRIVQVITVRRPYTSAR